MALEPDALARLRTMLLARRARLVESARSVRRGIEEIDDQEIGQEMEEDAQSSATAYVLRELGEAQQREVGLIDDALRRMEAGTYGVCVDCGNPISEARLRALPFATRDAGCQARAEADEKMLEERPSL